MRNEKREVLKNEKLMMNNEEDGFGDESRRAGTNLQVESNEKWKTNNEGDGFGDESERMEHEPTGGDQWKAHKGWAR